MLQGLDVDVSLFLNSFSQKSEVVDRFVTEILFLPSVRILPIAAGLVWLWFQDDGTASRRKAVINGIIGAAIALFIARAIQNFGVERPRPLYSTMFDFVPPFGTRSDVLRDWSSFPSDTSAIAFALAAGLWYGSKKLGFAGLLWASLAVSFPRIYAGYHYLSDILGGALIGLLTVYAVTKGHEKMRSSKAVVFTKPPYAPYFYAFSFVVLFEITIMFDDVRRILSFVSRNVSL